MSKKKLAIILIMIVCAVGVLFACGDVDDLEQIAINNGATVKVTLDLNGGVSSYKEIRYVRVKPGSPFVYPWSISGSGIDAPQLTGYNLEGFYTGTKDEDGKVTFLQKFEEKTRVYEDVTLYAKWVPRFYYEVIDIETNESVQKIYCASGAIFNQNSVKRAGYTALDFYTTNERAPENLWDESFTHPGFPDGVTVENASEEDYVVKVYGYFLEGDYTKVYKASDFLTVGATNFYLVGDENGEIDCSLLTGWLNHAYVYASEIIGNGVTIKNLNVTRENMQSFGDIKGVGLFGISLNGAKFTDVTFENCTVNIVYSNQAINFTGGNVINMGFFGGVASNTTLENVTLNNCHLNISVKRKTDSSLNVIAAYEESEPALWAGREQDAENGNQVNVNGSITVTYTVE